MRISIQLNFFLGLGAGGKVKGAGIQLTREGMFHGLVTKDLYIRHGTVVGIALNIEQSPLHQGCVGR